MMIPMARILAIGLFLRTLLWFIAVAEGRVVETTLGKVRGFEGSTRDGRTYFFWRGIPYAEPPVGERRFEPPLPAKNWTGVRNARFYPPKCSQFDLFFQNIQGVEDCLYLNVHVPEVKTLKVGELLPVIFAIHGGHFTSGESREVGPDYLLDEDVILVTMNYRLGVLGFLNTGDEASRGNMGLKDIRMALKWTYENIRRFGGNPKHIVVQGGSAGGVAANLLFIAKSTREYVHRAISFSGTALVPWAVHRDPAAQARGFATKAGCARESSNETVACLRSMDVYTLLKPVLGTSFLYVNWGWNINDVFVPSVETVITEDTFLTEHPYKSLKSGDFKPVPWFTSTNSAEALLPMTTFYNEKQFRQKVETEENQRVFGNGAVGIPMEMVGETSEVMKFYLGTKQDLHSFHSFKMLVNLLSDKMFFLGQQDAIQFHAERAPVYALHYNKTAILSLFDLVRGVRNRWPKSLEVAAEISGMILDHWILGKPRPDFGVAHADDSLMYTPFMGLASFAYRGSRDYKFSKEYVKLFIDFATDKSDLSFQGKQVPKYNPKKDQFAYFIVNEAPNSGIQQVPFKNRYLFWKSLMDKYPINQFYGFKP